MVLEFKESAPHQWDKSCTDVGLVFCTDVHLYIQSCVQTDK